MLTTSRKERGRNREKEKQRTKTKTAVGNGTVEFYSRNIGKLDQNRADVTGGPSKRTQKGKSERRGRERERRGREPERKETKRKQKETKRTGQEKEKRTKRRREEDSKRESGTGKGRRRRKPGNTAGNAGVKFDAGSKENSPKTVRTRPAGLRRGAEKTRGSPKRSRKGKMKEKEV